MSKSYIQIDQEVYYEVKSDQYIPFVEKDKDWLRTKIPKLSFINSNKENNSETVSYNGKTLNIFKIDDDWYYTYTMNKKGYVFFKCDQREGLAKLLEDLK